MALHLLVATGHISCISTDFSALFCPSLLAQRLLGFLVKALRTFGTFGTLQWLCRLCAVCALAALGPAPPCRPCRAAGFAGFWCFLSVLRTWFAPSCRAAGFRCFLSFLSTWFSPCRAAGLWCFWSFFCTWFAPPCLAAGFWCTWLAAGLRCTRFCCPSTISLSSLTITLTFWISLQLCQLHLSR